MKKKLLILLIFSSVNLSAQKNSVQLSPFSYETITFYYSETKIASPVYRVFYERKISPYFSTIAGLGYINNSFEKTASNNFSYSGLFHYTQIEAQLGLKASIFKKDKLIKPFFEQDFFFKRGSLEMLYNEEDPYYGTLVVSSRGQSVGLRTRVGFDIKLSPGFFVTVNSGVALGVGDITYNSSVDFNYIDSYYGSNFILSEFRFGYRF